eukprot:6794514-Prymnesium_polylepis.3
MALAGPRGHTVPSAVSDRVVELLPAPGCQIERPQIPQVKPSRVHPSKHQHEVVSHHGRVGPSARRPIGACGYGRSPRSWSCTEVNGPRVAAELARVQPPTEDVHGAATDHGGVARARWGRPVRSVWRLHECVHVILGHEHNDFVRRSEVPTLPAKDDELAASAQLRAEGTIGSEEHCTVRAHPRDAELWTAA